ncbi:hypothetical protein P350_11460 [Burkholderia cepacia JBK9]|nr:hypothetical protein P350_11460 [Burkholderia cepacia JBK9]
MDAASAALQQVIAAWVQAVGSILAICAAIGIAWWQWISTRKTERARLVRETKERFDAWEGIALAAVDVIRGIPFPDTPLGDVEEVLASNSFRARFLTAVEALRSIQIDTVHPYPIMSTILDLRRDMTLLEQLLPKEGMGSQRLLAIWLRMHEQIEEIRAKSADYASVFDAYARAARN